MAKTQLKFKQLKLASTDFAEGSGTDAGEIQLKATGVTSGTYGSGTLIPSLTIDAKGRVTLASTNDVTANPVNDFATADGILDMGGYQIDNLADGTASDHAVNKGQLDAAIAGLRWKEPVLAKDKGATYIDHSQVSLNTTTGVLELYHSDNQVFDRPLDIGDRVLIYGSSARKERNGIWEVSQEFETASFDLKLTSTTLSDYCATGEDRLFSIRAWDPTANGGSGDFISQQFKFEDSANGASFSEATGDLDSGNVVIQLNGLTTDEDIADEVIKAIFSSNSSIADHVDALREDDGGDAFIRISLAYALGVEPAGSGNGFIEVAVNDDIDDHFQKRITGNNFVNLAAPAAAGQDSVNPFSNPTPAELQLERADLADEEDELISAAVFVIADDEAYTCTSDRIPNINNAGSDINWVQFTGLGNVIAGKGISKTGNQLDIEMVREDDVVSLSSGVHTFASSHAQSYWEAVGAHPMTMVYLNGVLLEQAGSADDVGTAGNADGDYFIQYANSGNEIKLDADLAIDGDKITIIHASMT